MTIKIFRIVKTYFELLTLNEKYFTPFLELTTILFPVVTNDLVVEKTVTNVYYLELYMCYNVTYDVIKWLCNLFPMLKTLKICYCDISTETYNTCIQQKIFPSTLVYYDFSYNNIASIDNILETSSHSLWNFTGNPIESKPQLPLKNVVYLNIDPSQNTQLPLSETTILIIIYSLRDQLDDVVMLKEPIKQNLVMSTLFNDFSSHEDVCLFKKYKLYHRKKFLRNSLNVLTIKFGSKREVEEIPSDINVTSMISLCSNKKYKSKQLHLYFRYYKFSITQFKTIIEKLQPMFISYYMSSCPVDGQFTDYLDLLVVNDKIKGIDIYPCIDDGSQCSWDNIVKYLFENEIMKTSNCWQRIRLMTEHSHLQASELPDNFNNPNKIIDLIEHNNTETIVKQVNNDMDHPQEWIGMPISTCYKLCEIVENYIRFNH